MKIFLIYYLFIALSICVNSCDAGFKEEYSGTTSGTTDDTTTSSGLYVAVGSSGTVLKSTDGTTWTTVSATDSDNGSNSLSDNLKGVTYGSSTFVAVVVISVQVVPSDDLSKVPELPTATND